MGLEGIQAVILKKLANVTARPLSVVFELWNLFKFQLTGSSLMLSQVSIRVYKTDPGSYRPISFTSVPDIIMEKIIIEGIEKQLKDNVVISHSQYRSMRGKSCLSNQISVYDNINILC